MINDSPQHALQGSFNSASTSVDTFEGVTVVKVATGRTLLTAIAVITISACGFATAPSTRNLLQIPLTDARSGTTFTLGSNPGQVTIVEGMSVF